MPNDRVFYLTHPQVQIEPDVPVPQWGLSPIGRDRAKTARRANWLRGIVGVVSSAERKAVETAEIISRNLGIRIDVRQEMHENDRSATGFLPPVEFEQVANQFFALPDESVRGWERARDVQRRIVREAELALSEQPSGEILFVGHGAVGTLLMCHLAGADISRTWDQPAGGGHVFCFDRASRSLLHRWRPLEDPRIGAAGS